MAIQSVVFPGRLPTTSMHNKISLPALHLNCDLRIVAILGYTNELQIIEYILQKYAPRGTGCFRKVYCWSSRTLVPELLPRPTYYISSTHAYYFCTILYRGRMSHWDGNPDKCSGPTTSTTLHSLSSCTLFSHSHYSHLVNRLLRNQCECDVAGRSMCLKSQFTLTCAVKTYGVLSVCLTN